jgi:3-hydroxyisobutyrate dehydrogenase-like beta-hydroxyacid dehydrogenase
MITRRFEAGIPLRLYDKDLGIVLETARECGQVLPAAELVMSHIKMLAQSGDGDKDLAVLLRLVESMPSPFAREPQLWT